MRNHNDRRGRASRSPFLTKGTLWVCVVAAIAFARPAIAQATAQLTISLAVQSSISITFNDNPAAGTSGYCAFAAGTSGTNAAVLDLGTADFPSGVDSRPCIAITKGLPSGAYYQVSSAFDVVVTRANTTSSTYRLAAQISPAPPADVTWLLNGQALTTAMAPLTADTLVPYVNNPASPRTKTLQVQVKNNVAAGPLTETITFLATAN